MTSTQLFQAGKLREAIQALGAEVRDNPTDAKRRTFLFELLCFAGEYDRADKHLEVLAGGGQQALAGALLYRAALAAERTRQEMFRDAPPAAPLASSPGTLNGRGFQSLEDADPRIGARLELFAAGQYLWIPFEHIVNIRMEAPKRLRDLLWIPAAVTTGPAFRDKELGEVLLPVLSPSSWSHPADEVKLGRSTEWQGTIPFGQKLLVIDGEEGVSFLELRELDFAARETAVQAAP